MNANQKPYFGSKKTDPYLLFPGSSDSFANEDSSNLTFQFKVKNTFGANKVIALFPAYYDTIGLTVGLDSGSDVSYGALHYHDKKAIAAGGNYVDCVIDAGDILVDTVTPTKKVTITEVEGTIRDLVNFVKHNPTRVVELRVEAADRSAYTSDLTLRRVNPFLKGDDVPVKIKNYFDPNQFQTGMVIVDKPFQLDANTLALWTIPALANGVADVEVTFTFTIGAIESSARALAKKAELAYSNMFKK